MNQQEVNLKAAKLLGYATIRHDKSESCSIKIVNNTTRLFNVFTNPADCLAVVKMLGERFNTDIISVYESDTFVGFSVWGKKTHSRPYDNYEEAVVTAVMEVSDVDV